MNAALRGRELRLQGDLNERVNELVGVALELRDKAPGEVAGQIVKLLDRAARVTLTAGKLCEAIRVQHPAPRTGP